ncbi:MAG: hypothetical protein ACYDG2_22335 [Ruminiclostridium sp.]
MNFIKRLLKKYFSFLIIIALLPLTGCGNSQAIQDSNSLSGEVVG